MSDIDLIRKIAKAIIKVDVATSGPLNELELDGFVARLMREVGENDFNAFYSLSLLNILGAITVGDIFDIAREAARANNDKTT